MANLSPDLLMQQIHEYMGRAKPAKCWHEAPFDKDGNQVSYPSWNCEMQPVEQFEDELCFVEFVRGRSAANAIMRRRSNGTTVSLFLHDFEPLVRFLRDGKIDGIWIYVKRGENYGVAYA